MALSRATRLADDARRSTPGERSSGPEREAVLRRETSLVPGSASRTGSRRVDKRPSLDKGDNGGGDVVCRDSPKRPAGGISRRTRDSGRDEPPRRCASGEERTLAKIGQQLHHPAGEVARRSRCLQLEEDDLSRHPAVCDLNRYVRAAVAAAPEALVGDRIQKLGGATR